MNGHRGKRRSALFRMAMRRTGKTDSARAKKSVGDTSGEYEMRAPVYDGCDNFAREGAVTTKLYQIPKGRPVRIYCDGVYDLFHYGHAKQLEQAKHLFPSVHLLVGVTDDKTTNALKGTTVMAARERYESVRHCKHVDEVVEAAPWVLTEEFLAAHRIDFVAHDDLPYAGGGQEDIYAFLKNTQRFIATQRTPSISTTSLITRLLRDYDLFLRRQILRGISKEDLNISSFKERQVKIAEKLNVEIDGLKNELRDIMKYWETRSNKWLNSFISKFDGERIGWLDKLVNLVKKRKIFEN